MEDTGRVGVAIPAHGRPHYLAACLGSILAQTRVPEEIVVSEDGADPRTAALVTRLNAAGGGITHNRNAVPLGQRDNRQRAFELTSTEFVAMLDDDDQWEPTFLERTSEALRSHPECGFCSTDQLIIDATGGVLAQESQKASERFGRSRMTEGVYSDVLLRELRDKPFPLQATLFRRSALEAIEFFPTSAGSVPDFALYAQLGATQISAYYIAERLGRYRVHAGQQTENRVQQGEAMLAFLLDWQPVRELETEERRLLQSLFRSTVVELAIAHAHRRDRMRALRTLRHYSAMGWGWQSPSRLAVLLALLCGARGREDGSRQA